MNLQVPRGALLACVLLSACARQDTPPPAAGGADASFEQQLQERVQHALPGSVIAIAIGSHPLHQTLVLRASGVTLRGTGAESSTLSFAAAAPGAAGLVVTGNDVRIENLSIEDAPGDGLQISGGRNVSVRGLRVAWNRPAAASGASGIRAADAHGLLIEDSETYSAAASGIAVQRSRNAIVRRCHVEQNRTGIGVSNTVGADLADNIATGNGIGVLVASVPGAPQPGYATRVFGNRIYKNNLGTGAGPSDAASGVGVVVRAASQVEIFDNDIAYNQSANVLVVAAEEAPGGAAAQFDPYPAAIYVHGNRFTGGGNAPAAGPLKSIRAALFAAPQSLPDVVWDGRGAGARKRSGGPPQLCVRNGTARVLNTDAAHAYARPAASATAFACELPRLPAVVLSLPTAPARLGS